MNYQSNDFFALEERRSALALAVKRWNNTPFQGRGNVCGAGVDCSHLMAALLNESGFAHPCEWPQYSLSEGLHCKESRLEKYLDTQPRLRRLALNELEIGDILGFREKNQSMHHLGLVTSPTQFMQAITRYGAREWLIKDSTWYSRLVAAWRPTVSPKACFEQK